MAGRETSLEILSANFLTCSKVRLNWGSLPGELHLWCNMGHKPAHFVLLWTKVGSRAELHAQCERGRAGLIPWGNPFSWCNESCLSTFVPFLAFRSCDSPGYWGSGFLASLLLELAGSSSCHSIYGFRAANEQCSPWTQPPVRTPSSPRTWGRLGLQGS